MKPRIVLKAIFKKKKTKTCIRDNKCTENINEIEKRKRIIKM